MTNLGVNGVLSAENGIVNPKIIVSFTFHNSKIRPVVVYTTSDGT